jgi:hypothetical protein
VSFLFFKFLTVLWSDIIIISWVQYLNILFEYIIIVVFVSLCLCVSLSLCLSQPLPLCLFVSFVSLSSLFRLFLSLLSFCLFCLFVSLSLPLSLLFGILNWRTCVCVCVCVCVEHIDGSTKSIEISSEWPSDLCAIYFYRHLVYNTEEPRCKRWTMLHCLAITRDFQAPESKNPVRSNTRDNKPTFNVLYSPVSW